MESASFNLEDIAGIHTHTWYDQYDGRSARCFAQVRSRACTFLTAAGFTDGLVDSLIRHVEGKGAGTVYQNKILVDQVMLETEERRPA